MMAPWATRGRLRRLVGVLLSVGCFLAAPGRAGEVWHATFTTGADGVVDVFDNNSGKVMLGSAGAGVLPVEVWDNATDAYTPDKAGRPLGGVVGGADSFSALYRFRWSDLNEDVTHAWEAAGFFGSSASPQTRQVLVALMRHWKVGGDYYVRVGIGFSASSGFGYSAGSTINLGAAAENTDYQLALGYDGTTNVCTVGLYDAAGNLITGQSADLATLNTQPNQLSLLALDHLGWSDYTSSASGDRATIWEVDSLIYYSTADGAASNAAAPEEPVGACELDGGSTCLAWETELDCLGFGGDWLGPDTLCAGEDPNDEPWEVVFDGVDTAADNVANWLRWDNPIDDDWEEVDTTYMINTPSPGFLTVDRATRPEDANKTGNMWIRDPLLSNDVGITLEVRVRIEANSTTNAFSINYLDTAGSWGVHLSPGQIKAGLLSQGGAGVTVPFDTTDDFHLYRIVMLPNTLSIRVYVDNDPTPIVTSVGSVSAWVGSHPRLTYPRVLVGDNSNSTTYSAHYVLDFIRYRRGATAPGEMPATFPPRQLPALPGPAAHGEPWIEGFDGTAKPALPDWIPAGSSGAWTVLGDGTVELNTLAAPANARREPPIEPWTDMEAITLEARIKVMPDCEEAGFNLWVNDTLGGTSLNLSPDRAELNHGSKPSGRAMVFMDTTDDFHTYRLVREALHPFGQPNRLGREIYWHLYIDNDPVPAVAWQHAVGVSTGYSLIYFGDLIYPIFNNGGHVIIDHIRWYEGAYAPPRYADLNRDGVIDLHDVVLLQDCFGAVPEGACTACDLNGDGVIDTQDLAEFTACMADPGGVGCLP